MVGGVQIGGQHVAGSFNSAAVRGTCGHIDVHWEVGEDLPARAAINPPAPRCNSCIIIDDSCVAILTIPYMYVYVNALARPCICM